MSSNYGPRRPSEPNTDIRLLQAQTRLRSRGFRFARHNEPPDENLLARRPLYYIAFLLILFSGILQQPLLFIAGLLILVLGFVPELWYRYSLHHLFVDRSPSTTRALLGDTIEMTLTIENRKPLPLPWFEIVDEIPESLPIEQLKVRPSAKPDRAMLTNTLALWAYQRIRRRYRIHALARGAYRFGPMILRASDPFGILTRETTLEQPAAVLVHPLVTSLEHFGLPAQAPFGERKSPRRLLEDPLRFSGIRDYVSGDEPRRIHWKATARTGTLQSKVYEPSTSHTVAIFLDIRTLSDVSMGYDPALSELQICAAASVANWAIEQGYAVGIFSNGTLGTPELAETTHQATSRKDTTNTTAADRVQREIERTSAAMRMRVPPSSHQQQLIHIFDALARLLPYYGLPMDQVIATEERQLPVGATVIYIGTEITMDVPLILALRRLKSRGYGVSLLLTHAFGATQESNEHAVQLSGLDTHYIGGRATWASLISDVLGREGRDVLSYQRGFTSYVARPPSQTPGASDTSDSSTGTDILTNSLDDDDNGDTSGNSEENGVGDGQTRHPTHKSNRRSSRALVVE